MLFRSCLSLLQPEEQLAVRRAVGESASISRQRSEVRHCFRVGAIRTGVRQRSVNEGPCRPANDLVGPQSRQRGAGRDGRGADGDPAREAMNHGRKNITAFTKMASRLGLGSFRRIGLRHRVASRVPAVDIAGGFGYAAIMLRAWWSQRVSIVAWTAAVLVTVSLRAEPLLLDAQQTGREFAGVGGVSAGASSRLLVDYPEPQRSQILDYLFKPNYGASLQHLKVEIGGDVNSTDGTEPTFEMARGNLNFTRGYEWWLMQQANARNPNIILDCLAWGAPGWIGNGNYYSQDMCNYIVNFIQGAQTTCGLTFNFTGTHNEAAVNTTETAWIKQLRSTLNADG